MAPKIVNLAGILAILAIAWLLSTNRKAIRLRIVGPAFALQAVIAFLVLYTSWGRAAIQAVDFAMDHLKSDAWFWKREKRADGWHWIEPRTDDHADLARWR